MYEDGVFHKPTLPGYRQTVMNLSEALKLIDDLVFTKEGRHLKPDEITVIEAAWSDLGYKQIAENSPYRADDLHHHVGPKLWRLLSTVLGNGEKVTKKRLRTILEQRTTLPAPYSLSDISSQSNPNNTSPSDCLTEILGSQ